MTPDEHVRAINDDSPRNAPRREVQVSSSDDEVSIVDDLGSVIQELRKKTGASKREIKKIRAALKKEGIRTLFAYRMAPYNIIERVLAEA